MGDSKKVSIVLPTHNGHRYIQQSINSCLNQTYKNIELIIVDDGSTDNTPEIVKNYSDPRMKYVRKNTNSGVSRALNKGFSQATGEYLTWTSDDNYFSPQAIEFMVEALEMNKEVDFVYANHYRIDEKGKRLQSVRAGSSKKLIISNCIGPCFLYRKRVYEEIGDFNPEAFLSEDYEYWLRVREKFRMQKLGKYLYYYRSHKDNLSFQHEDKVDIQGERIRDRYIKTDRDRYINTILKYYLRGARHFRKKDYPNAKRLLIKFLLFNPLNLDAWKLLVQIYLIYLSPSMAERIKRFKRAILRQG